MSRCDYVRKIHNVGHSTSFKKLFPFLVSWQIDEIDDVLQKHINQKIRIEHKMRLSASATLLTYAPVLDEDFKLAPLNILKNEINWGLDIGFECDPKVFLPVEEQHYEKASRFDEYSFHIFNGGELPDRPVPMCDLSRDDVPK